LGNLAGIYLKNVEKRLELRFGIVENIGFLYYT
jgi:hypothetical protein